MQSGAPALRSAMEGTSCFLAWWRDELLGMVPERLRRLLMEADGCIVLAKVDGGFQIIEEPASRARRRPGAAPRPLSREEALGALAKLAATRRFGAVGIRLKPAVAIVRQYAEQFRLRPAESKTADPIRLRSFDPPLRVPRR